jgi:hypothetical protein
MAAGLAIHDTVNLHHLPIAPWAGLSVVAARAAASLLAGDSGSECATHEPAPAPALAG